MRTPTLDETRLCRTCGDDITLHAKYTNWTQCSLCYWRDQFSRCEPLPTLTKSLRDISSRLGALSESVSQARRTLDEYRAHLQATAPWLKRLFATPSDARLIELTERFSALSSEQRELRSKLDGTKRAVAAAKHAKERLTQAELARIAAERKAKQEQEEHADYNDQSERNLENSFDRSLFFIHPHDYRRGNAIDNYCRATFFDSILAAFDHQCSFCGCTDDLTFDHYGLTKNEGGNFVLLASDKRSLRVNVVVLCRGCNSTKGQRPYHQFFDDTRQLAIIEHHKRFLADVLGDRRFQKLLRKWGGMA